MYHPNTSFPQRNIHGMTPAVTARIHVMRCWRFTWDCLGPNTHGGYLVRVSLCMCDSCIVHTYYIYDITIYHIIIYIFCIYLYDSGMWICVGSITDPFLILSSSRIVPQRLQKLSFQSQTPQAPPAEHQHSHDGRVVLEIWYTFQYHTSYVSC